MRLCTNFNFRLPILALAMIVVSDVLAFDSKAWQLKRERFASEATAAAMGFTNCNKSVELQAAKGIGMMPAENVSITLETNPDGSVKSAIRAELAQGLDGMTNIWAKGVKVSRYGLDSSDNRVEAAWLKAERCLVNRVTRGGWADGAAMMFHEGNLISGRGVYFSSSERFVKITNDASVDMAVKAGSFAELKGDNRLRIHGNSADLDLQLGVVAFDGVVKVDYGTNCTLRADRLFVFSDASNRFERVVASGNVSVENGERTGSCQFATFVQEKELLEMFGEQGGAMMCEGENLLQGDRIRVWLKSEQVEVDSPRIVVGKSKGGVLK